MIFYFNDFQNFKIVNLTNNSNKANTDKFNNTSINTNSKNFIYVYNITFDALIDKKTLFKCKFYTKNIFNSTNHFKYINDTDNNKIELQDLNKLRITFENSILYINTGYSFFTTFNESKTKNVKIGLINKIGYFSSFDSTIDPDILDFSVRYFEKFIFFNEGWSYIYKIIELVEDRDLMFTKFEKKHILQIETFSSIALVDYYYKDYLDIFSFYVSRKVRSQLRIYKKIQNVLAEIGGIFSILTLIGNIILKKINQIKFEIDIINNLFSNSINLENLKKNENCLADNKINLIISKLKTNYNIPHLIEPDKILANGKNNKIKNKNFYINNSTINFFRDSAIRYEKENTQREILEFNSINLIENRCLDKSYNKNESKNIFKDKSILNFKRIFLHKKSKNICSSKTMNLDKIYQFIKEKKNKKKTDIIIKFSYFDIIKYLFCGKRFKDENFLKQEKIHIHVERKVNGYLNILKLMKLFENFERLKKLILNNHKSAYLTIQRRGSGMISIKTKQSHYLIYLYILINQKLSKFHNIIPDDKVKILLDQDIINLLNL